MECTSQGAVKLSHGNSLLLSDLVLRVDLAFWCLLFLGGLHDANVLNKAGSSKAPGNVDPPGRYTRERGIQWVQIEGASVVRQVRPAKPMLMSGAFNQSDS